MRIRLGTSKELYSGLVFLAIAVAWLIGALQYPIGTVTSMGPGYFPVALGIILAVIGCALMVRGARQNSDPIERREVLPTILIVLGMLGFAFLIDRAGLIPAIVVLLALPMYRRILSHPVEAILTIGILAGSAAGIFIYGLQMPIEPF